MYITYRWLQITTSYMHFSNCSGQPTNFPFLLLKNIISGDPEYEITKKILFFINLFKEKPEKHKYFIFELQIRKINKKSSDFYCLFIQFD